MTKETKTEKLNIYQRLLAVMADVDYIQKTKGENNLKYSFASHDAVTAKCRESFIKHGIYAEVKILKDSIEKISIHKEKAGYNNAPKVITDTDSFVSYVKLRIKFINIDNPEDFAIGDGVGQGIDDQDKACGKATSYAYKYALLKALAIETGDDPEQDVDYKIVNQPKTPLQKVAEGATDDMKQLQRETNENDKKIIENLLNASKSEEEVQDIIDSHKKQLAKLSKYAPDLFVELKKVKDDLLAGFKQAREMGDFDNGLDDTLNDIGR